MYSPGRSAAPRILIFKLLALSSNVSLFRHFQEPLHNVEQIDFLKLSSLFLNVTFFNFFLVTIQKFRYFDAKIILKESLIT